MKTAWDEPKAVHLRSARPGFTACGDELGKNRSRSTDSRSSVTCQDCLRIMNKTVLVRKSKLVDCKEMGLNSKDIAKELLKVAAALVKGSPLGQGSPSGFFKQRGNQAKILRVLSEVVLGSETIVKHIAQQAGVKIDDVKQALQGMAPKGSRKDSPGYQRPPSGSGVRRQRSLERAPTEPSSPGSGTMPSRYSAARAILALATKLAGKELPEGAKVWNQEQDLFGVVVENRSQIVNIKADDGRMFAYDDEAEALGDWTAAKRTACTASATSEAAKLANQLEELLPKVKRVGQDFRENSGLNALRLRDFHPASNLEGAINELRWIDEPK